MTVDSLSSDPTFAPKGADIEVPRAQITADDGVLAVDKPLGITSHDVVARLRRLAATRKVGHAGTLDPAASGVLVVGLGRGTKLLQYLQGLKKTYIARVCFGVETDSEDAQGTITAKRGAGIQDLAGIQTVLQHWCGQVMQVPSAFSALKIRGRRAADRIRSGENVQLPARPITIYELTLLGQPEEGVLDGVRVVYQDIRVTCSAGTYVRALGRDLGNELGIGAHLRGLRRVRVGLFGVESARNDAEESAFPVYNLQELSRLVTDEQQLPVVNLDEICARMFPVCPLNAEVITALGYGQRPPANLETIGGCFANPDTIYALADDQGSIAFLARLRDNSWRSVLNLRS